MAISSEQLEREAEQSRERLTTKLEELRAQITPGQVVDQLADYVRDSGGGEFVRNLGRQVRDNPLPVALMGAALGWLMIGGGRRFQNGGGAGNGRAAGSIADTATSLAAGVQRKSQTLAAGARRAADDVGDAFRDQLTGAQRGASAVAQGTASVASRVADASRQAQERLSELGDRAVSAAESVTDAVGSAYQRAADSTSDVTRRVGDKAASITQNTTAATRNIASFLEDQPLVLAGIGIALGAALGAALPRTALEDQTIGEASDELKQKGQELASETFEQVKSDAQAGYEAAKDEAEHQGVPTRVVEATAIAPGD